MRERPGLGHPSKTGEAHAVPVQKGKEHVVIVGILAATTGKRGHSPPMGEADAVSASKGEADVVVSSNGRGGGDAVAVTQNLCQFPRGPRRPMRIAYGGR
mmetsp:Transcript_3588/g.7942  ORF Transcript_3588/g.7942 Transcript_3588/m.7942 type:complete len:100 (+) Transcript_3588:417-716(+)